MTDLNMAEMFDNVYKEVSKLWKTYWSIFKILRSEFIYLNGDHIRKETKKFLEISLSVNQPNKVTSYVHVLFFHKADFYDDYGPLNYFANQGLEKLNDLSTHNSLIQQTGTKNTQDRCLNTTIVLKIANTKNHCYNQFETVFYYNKKRGEDLCFR